MRKLTKKATAILLAILMIVNIIVVIAPSGGLGFVADAAEGITGSGTSDDPYLIYSLSDFDFLRNHLDADYKLMNDIDLSVVDGEWIPIGTYSSSTELYPSVGDSFSGVFDGNGHKIYNLKMFCGGRTYVYNPGLFSATINATIKNLGVCVADGYTMTKTKNVGKGHFGLLAGVTRDTTIYRCYIYGNVNMSASYASGMLIGNACNSKIDECYVAGSFSTSSNYTGQITGAAYGTFTNSFSALNSSMKLFGSIWGGTMKNCYTTSSSLYTEVKTVTRTNSFIGKDNLLNKDTFSGWEFDSVWAISPYVNNGYPYLRFSQDGLQKNGSDPDDSISVWDGAIASGFASGTGTESDPYIIETAEQLAYLADSANKGESYTSKYVKVTKDIYLNDIADFDNWESASPKNTWNPFRFSGNFDGGNFTIFGIYCNNSYQSGLFAYCGGSVENVNLSNMLIVNGNYSGGVTAEIGETAVINNCSVSGKIVSDDSITSRIGGIVANISSSKGAIISNCRNDVDIIGGNYVGGIIGEVSNAYIFSVEDCVNAGSITGTSTNAWYGGGICGRVEPSISLSGGNEINLQHCVNLGSVKTYCDVGGMVGYCEPERGSNINISECYNTADLASVKISSSVNSAGGIVGKACCSSGYVNISDCFNSGKNVSTSSTNSGIVGYHYSPISGTVYVKRSINICDSAEPTWSSGIAGFSDNFIGVDNSYYLDTSCLNPDDSKMYGQVVTSGEMKDSTKLSGLDFDSVWAISPYVNNGYPYLRFSQEGLPSNLIEGDAADEWIIEEVKKYTSDEICELFNAIMDNPNHSYEVKFKALNNFFNTYGLTDVREGINYLSTTSSYRSDYLYLTTDEIYCANNFGCWLYQTPKGIAARHIMALDGLIYNYELYDYIDPMTYATDSLPEVERSKKLLVDFMECESDCLTVDILSDSNKAYKYLSNICKFNDIEIKGSLAELRSRIDKAPTKAEKAALTKQYLNDYIVPINAENPNGRFFLYTEAFNKAMGYAGNIIGFAGAGAEDIYTFLNLESEIETYNNYRKFLTTVKQSKDLSINLRLAAAQLLDTIENGYYNNILKTIADVASFSSDMVMTYVDADKWALLFGEGGEFFGNALATLKLATFVSNIVIDTGDFVENAYFTEGYAALSALYSQILQNDKANFILSPTAENAWQFYEDYNILWKLRYMGEKQYLKMNEVKMYIFAKVKLDKYDIKEEIVKDTLKHLDGCKFEMADNVVVPESVQYLHKSVIECPVDINIYTQSGILVASLKDGVESDIVNEYGRFAVVYEPYDGEYTKVICQSTDDVLNFELNAISDGMVNCKMANVGDNLTTYSFDNMEIYKGDKITFSSNISDGYCIEYSDSSFANESFTFIDDNSYVAVQSIVADKSEIVLAPGASELLETKVTPENATESYIIWSSSDDNIVTVKNGVITANGIGSATIFATAIADVTTEAEYHIEVVPPISLTALGGSVRIVDPYGLRFGIQLLKDDAYKQYKDIITGYGTLIIPKKNLGDNALTFATDKVKDVPAVNIYSEDDSQLTYTGVLVGIPKTSFYSDIVGRGYLKYKDIYGNEKVMYTDEIIRSYYQVADSAYTRYGKMTNRTETEESVYQKLGALLAKMTDGDNLTNY